MNDTGKRTFIVQSKNQSVSGSIKHKNVDRSWNMPNLDHQVIFWHIYISCNNKPSWCMLYEPSLTQHVLSSILIPTKITKHFCSFLNSRLHKKRLIIIIIIIIIIHYSNQSLKLKSSNNNISHSNLLFL